MPNITHIVPDATSNMYASWHFPPAVISNDLVFCSGIIGFTPGGRIPDFNSSPEFDGLQEMTDGGRANLDDLRPIGDPELQFTMVFEVLRSVLRYSGVTLSDVVEMTSYHVRLSELFNTFEAVKDRYFSGPYPAWTAIGVTELAEPGALVEVRAIAAL